jgi:hypothetical protein
LDLSYRQLAAQFNCSHTHVMHLTRLVEVEDAYKSYLADLGLSQHERDVRLARVAELSDKTLLKVFEAPKAYWAALLDVLPAHRWIAEGQVETELARLQGKEEPEPEPDPPRRLASATPATLDPPAQDPNAPTSPSASAGASTPTLAPADDAGTVDFTRGDAFEKYAQTVAAQQQTGVERRLQAEEFEQAVMQVHWWTHQVLQYRPFAVEVCDDWQRRRMETVVEAWSGILDEVRAERPGGCCAW